MKETENKMTLKKSVFSGLVWSFGERIIAQMVSFIVSIVLARFLLPREYGIIAMVLVFINIANVFTNGGFGEALVQKKDSDFIDFSTVFYCTLMVSMIVYIILFFTAPFIAKFYNTNEIIWVLRILGLKIIISAVSTIQHAYVQKNMIFKKFFFSTLGGTLVSGIIGIMMAVNGCGVWSLVVQYLSNTIIDMLVLFFTVPWRPCAIFSKDSAIELMNFGWKLVAANLVNSIYNELRSLFIGKVYNSADLAFYNRGNQIPSLAITNIDTAIANVMFPAMASASSKEQLKTIGRRAMKTTSYIIFPLMIGLMIIAPSLIQVLLTDKWSGAVIFMQILCVYWMTQPIQTTNWQIIKALGRSDICLKLEVIKKIIGIGLIIISLPISVEAVAYSAAMFGIISMFINIAPNKKLVNYSFIEQFEDILPALISSVSMGAVVYLISLLGLSQIITLLIQIMSGIVVYLFISWIFKLEAFYYLLSIISTKIRS